jgi:glycosyltransferase involved in cell wall biosynthesis
MDTPLVSVCIPNYNNADFLGQAIQSALDQTIHELEVVVCDNQSTDNSVEVVRAFEDPRVRLFVNDRNLGIYHNFQRTAEEARGHYLKFLCADDWLEPDYLAVTLPYFERYPRLGLVTTKQAIIANAGEIVGYRDAPVPGQILYTTEDYLNASLRRANPIGNPTRVIVPRAVFDQVGGFDPANEFSGDLDLWLRIVAEYDIAALPDVCCYERKHIRQNTVWHVAQATDIHYICMAFEKSFKQLPDYWTPTRRRALCRHALGFSVQRGLLARARGNRQYWNSVVGAISRLCPPREWLLYHLIMGPLIIAKVRVYRAGRYLRKYVFPGRTKVVNQ